MQPQPCGMGRMSNAVDGPQAAVWRREGFQDRLLSPGAHRTLGHASRPWRATAVQTSVCLQALSLHGSSRSMGGPF